MGSTPKVQDYRNYLLVEEKVVSIVVSLITYPVQSIALSS